MELIPFWFPSCSLEVVKQLIVFVGLVNDWKKRQTYTMQHPVISTVVMYFVKIRANNLNNQGCDFKVLIKNGSK